MKYTSTPAVLWVEFVFCTLYFELNRWGRVTPSYFVVCIWIYICICVENLVFCISHVVFFGLIAPFPAYWTYEGGSHPHFLYFAFVFVIICYISCIFVLHFAFSRLNCTFSCLLNLLMPFVFCIWIVNLVFCISHVVFCLLNCTFSCLLKLWGRVTPSPWQAGPSLIFRAWWLLPNYSFLHHILQVLTLVLVLVVLLVLVLVVLVSAVVL